MIENDQIRNLIQEILTTKPTKRPKTGDILNNTWLNKNGEEKVDLDLSADEISYGSLLESVDSVSQESDSTGKVESSNISDLAAELDKMAAEEKNNSKPKHQILPSGKNVFGQ